MSGCQVARPFSKNVEHMTKELTALVSSTMNFQKTHVLPDGNSFTVASNIFSEVLFQPYLIGNGASEIHGISFQLNVTLTSARICASLSRVRQQGLFPNNYECMTKELTA